MKLIKNMKCKSSKRDFENDRDFFWRQSTKPIKISNLLFVLAIRERKHYKSDFFTCLGFRLCSDCLSAYFTDACIYPTEIDVFINSINEVMDSHLRCSVYVYFFLRGSNYRSYLVKIVLWTAFAPR